MKNKNRQDKKVHAHQHESISEIKKEMKIKLDEELDKALEDTFPASDATAKY